MIVLVLRTPTRTPYESLVVMSTEPEKAREPENRDKENGEETKAKGQFLDPKQVRHEGDRAGGRVQLDCLTSSFDCLT